MQPSRFAAPSASTEYALRWEILVVDDADSRESMDELLRFVGAQVADAALALAEHVCL